MTLRISIESRGVTRTFEIDRSVVTLGRSKNCTVAIDDVALSRTHCQIELEDGACFVRDLNSRNGTFLGEERVDRVAIRVGDVITIGKTAIHLLGEAEADRAPADRGAEPGLTARLTARIFEKRAAPVRAGADEGDAVELRKLLDVIRRISRDVEPARVLTQILDSAVEFAGAERGFLLLVEKRRLRVPIARDFWRKDIASPAFELSRSIALEVVRRGEPLLTADAADDERFEENVSVYDLDLRSVLCVPLRLDDEVIGAIYLDNRFTRGAFRAEDVPSVTAFADQAALAVARSRAYEATRVERDDWRRRAHEIEARSRALEEHVRQLEAADGRVHPHPDIIGRSPAMRACLALVDRIAPTDLAVLVRGESGVGKELVARALHAHGPRRGRPFVVVDCAALAPGLVEPELFGSVRGAFTGSVATRRGLLETADGGTVFLDEIGELGAEAQKRLLRVLESGELRRIGETQPRRLDLRVISATHRDLETEVARGAFREDLLYRLNGVRIDVPPLRERTGDVPILARHFLARGGRRIALDPEALEALAAWRWPGNVRELKNEMERLAVQVKDRVRREDLSADLRRAAPQQDAPETLREAVERLEIALLKAALARHEGNKTRVAEELGLSRLGLRKKMARYGLADGPGPA